MAADESFATLSQILARMGSSTIAITREALRSLKERDQEREQLRADVRAGFDQLARREGTLHDKASGRRLAERIKADGRQARARKR